MPVVPPLLLQRICDAGRTAMDASEVVIWAADLAKQHGEAFMLAHPYYPGCGTEFQFYFGSGCRCPECGKAYEVRMDHVREGRYAVKSP